MFRQKFQRHVAEAAKDAGTYNIEMKPGNTLTLNIGPKLRLEIAVDDSGEAIFKVLKMVPKWETVDVISTDGEVK